MDIFTSSLLEGIQRTAGVFGDLEAEIAARSLMTVQFATAALLLLTLVAVITNKRVPQLKLPLFIGIAGIMIVATLSMIGSTIYLNVKSDSGGPVHWHADTEVWACGSEIELRDPTGFSNKIGTPTLHEHDDHRIHLEGVVVDRTVDATIGKFMNVIGGGITEKSLTVPVNPSSGPLFEDEFDGDSIDETNRASVESRVAGDDNNRSVSFVNGETCGEKPAVAQVFVYKVNDDNKTYSQYKLNDPATRKALGINSVEDYSISETPNVPPGDCIIFEFDVPKDTTDKLCKQFGVRDIERCEQFGVEPDQREICSMQEVPNTVGSEPTEQVVCNITYDKKNRVVGVNAPGDFDDSATFDPATYCSNYPKNAEGNID